MFLTSIDGIPNWPIEKKCSCGAHFVIDLPHDLRKNLAGSYETHCPICGRIFVINQNSVPDIVKQALKPKPLMTVHD